MPDCRGTLMAALGGLTLSCFFLSSRYRSSASFESPLHLTLATLLLTGLALRLPSRTRQPAGEPPSSVVERPLPPSSSVSWTSLEYESGHVPPTDRFLRRARRSSPQVVLVGCIVTRCLLLGLVVRTSQCARPGIETLLPVLSLLCEFIYPTRTKPADLGTPGPGKPSRPARSPPAIPYLIFSLCWAVSAILALAHSRADTGAICPAGWQWAWLTQGAQLGSCALDAAALRYGAQLRSREVETGRKSCARLTTGLLVAFGCLLFLCSSLWVARPSLCLTCSLGSIHLRDLTLDSLLASVALVSGYHLLADLHPTSVALLVSESSLFGYGCLHLNFMSRHQPRYPPLDKSSTTSFLTVVLAALLWSLAASASHTSRTRVSRLHRGLLTLHIALVIFALVKWKLLLTSSSVPSISEAVEGLVASARDERAAWASQAASTTTLSGAVDEYKKRYGMPPPPNFDKWYEYAVKNKSPVIDDFAQIHSDILPFWGVEPSKIRESTARLMSYAYIEMGALRIRNGTIHQSPHVPGTHRWMTNMVEKMIEPFAQWLPDMVLAINLADECRVSVPTQVMEALWKTAQGAISRVGGNAETVKSDHEPDAERGWAFEFPEPKPWNREGATSPQQVTPDFVDYHGRQIYHDWIAPACPPGSAARSTRWWDWSSVCSACMAPHSLMTSGGAIMANKTLAHDLCHQPDVARLDGFIMSPTVFIGSSGLLPVFSQSRVGGFSDILIPSPWDFEDKSAHVEGEDVPWSDKTNGLYWRGSSTDGFAAGGRWLGFLRARFVHEAFQRATRRGGTGLLDRLRINVSFVGDIPRCESDDCAAELNTFKSWAMAAQDSRATAPGEARAPAEEDSNRLPSPLPFKESWHFRHLMDMDGAGFSGRFLSFLRSHSLVYRAALFKAWYDERLFGWHDYVPVDVRLGSGFWNALYYLAGVSETTPSGAADGKRGTDTAQMIAEQGRSSASGVLRQEDMHIYMFRLLLEYGRVTDDDREALAYKHN